jgi:hypothetical protein
VYLKQLDNLVVANHVCIYVSSTAEQHIHQVKQRQDDKERREILVWLTPVDYGPQQSDYINRRQPGTGKWLLDSAKYQAWLLGALSGTPFVEPLPAHRF